MSTPILATKFYIPPPRLHVILRPRLIERLNEGWRRKLTLISAPAGFGKTTLIGEWVAGCEQLVAWLSLDEGDSDLTRFLTYLVVALQKLALPNRGATPRGVKKVATNIGQGMLSALQAPQRPPIEAILTALLNEITTLPDDFILVLDDYHVIDAKPIDQALAFLLEHLPPQMHLVIATREDPHLPLAQLRVQDQLSELRVNDLRFAPSEAAEFLNQVMGLNLSSQDIAALETRTEGWIAGLQLAAISMRGQKDAVGFIQSFSGSHHFVMDYLVEQVLQQQSQHVQHFLLRTSILERMCGSLCDVVCSVGTDMLDPAASGQETLEALEHANLFIVPLDNERRWYRYHHLFADLLRQRLSQSAYDVAELHKRASQWFEDNGLEIEAFRHAVAAHDVERAARLVEGKGMPLQFRGAVTPVLDWLKSLPKTVLDARPSLWVMYASALSMTGQTTGVEEKLQAAEAALQEPALSVPKGAEPEAKTRNLIGHIAAIRALLAAAQNQPDIIIAQSRRALEYLHPDNRAVRTATIWKLGIAYQMQGDRAAAKQAYTEAISAGEASGNIIIHQSATLGLGNVQETETQLYLAAESYRRILQLVGDPPQPAACEAHLGLARIFYEWNDLDSAEQHGQQSVSLARHIDNPDRAAASDVLLARVRLARGDVAGATSILAQAEQVAHQHNLLQRMPEIAAAQVLLLLRQGNLAAAAQLAQTHQLLMSQARVRLAQGDPTGALAVLEPLRQQMEAKGWQDEQLKIMVLQALALDAHGEKDDAARLLGNALGLAETGGLTRLFVDEGEPMRFMISDLRLQIEKRHGETRLLNYADKLLAAFPDSSSEQKVKSEKLAPHSRAGIINPKSEILPEPLSQRELEVLRLIAQGLSNREISEQLVLALSTVKGHNREIFDKLQVESRTAAVARARELGLL